MSSNSNKNSRNCKRVAPKHAPTCCIQSTNLSAACGAVRLSIRSKPLKRVIDEQPLLNRQVFAVEHLQTAFTETLEAIRQLDVRYVFDGVDGKSKRAFMPLFPLCRILGICVPESVDGTDSDDTLWDFATKRLNIAFDDIHGVGEYLVATDAALVLIRYAVGVVGYPEITRQLEEWFVAHVAERILAAPWDVLFVDEVYALDESF